MLSRKSSVSLIRWIPKKLFFSCKIFIMSVQIGRWLVSQKNSFDFESGKVRMIQNLFHRYSFVWRSFKHFRNQVSCQRSQMSQIFIQLRWTLIKTQIKFNHGLLGLVPWNWGITTNFYNPIKLVNIGTTSKYFITQVKLKN